MKKKINITYICLLSILLISCGFKKINQVDNSLIYIKEARVIGEKRIGFIIKNGILLISDKTAQDKYKVIINVKKNKTKKIKDSTGRTTRYNMAITTKITLTQIKNLEITSKIFVKNLDYDAATNHSDTIRNEKTAIEYITTQQIEDIKSFITILTSN